MYRTVSRGARMGPMEKSQRGLACLFMLPSVTGAAIGSMIACGAGLSYNKALAPRKTPKPRSKTPFRLLGISAWAVMVLVATRWAWDHRARGPKGISKQSVAASVGPSLRSNRFPDEIEVTLPAENIKALARYTLDPVQQARIEKTLAQYRPDYGAFVALDASTGKVLVLASYTHSKEEKENLTLKASFPAASIFKIVTAAAALDQGVLSVDTVIPFNGANHTLYRRNVTDQKLGRWTRQITLREAFAKSVNTVFGKIGMYVLEPMQLKEYAERFQFNKAISGDVPAETGMFELSSEEPWGVAEVASGFNRVSSMSPLQGALIAAAVANDGVMMEPYVVEELKRQTGEKLYEAQPKATSITMKSQTASELRQMMRETVTSGTSRSAFRTLLRKPAYRDIEIGGKTGSLRGLSPKGKCDWFVGYARSGNARIAVAALTVNEDLWRVKASYLARMYFEDYFRARTTASTP
jgi:penicillin-binding protein A